MGIMINRAKLSSAATERREETTLGKNQTETTEKLADFRKTLKEAEKKEEPELEKIKKILKIMEDTMKRQPNINKDVKDGRKTLEDIHESL